MKIRIKSRKLNRIASVVCIAGEVDYDLRRRIAEELWTAAMHGYVCSVEVSPDDCAIIASVCLRRGIGAGKLFAIAGAPEAVVVPETVTRDDVLAAEKAFEELQRPGEPEAEQGNLF